MVEPESSLKKVTVFLHAIVVILWLGFSTVFYGLFVVTLSYINLQWARYFVVVWSRQLLFVSGISSRIRGLEKLNKSETFIFVANHSSVFDIPVLHAVLPFHFVFIAKKELFSIPIFGTIIHAAGNIAIDRSNAKNARLSLDKAVAGLKSRAQSLVLFPEGTRTENGSIGTFKTASLTLALEAGITIVPVYISGTFTILKKDSFHISPGMVECIIADPIPYAEYAGLQKNELSEKIRAVLIGMEMKTATMKQDKSGLEDDTLQRDD